MSDLFSSLLPLERSGDDAFVIGPPGSGFLFGGLSMAMILRAAAATVEPGKTPLSLHTTFLAGGDWGGPHELAVERVNDTRAFAVRRIEMRTAGRLAVVGEAVFHQPEAGEDWQAMRRPDAPAPETLTPYDNQLPLSVLDIRPARPAPEKLERLHPYWCRTHEALADPTLIACALAYASDFLVIATPFPAGSGRGDGLVSRTYSHALTFHRPPPSPDWWFFDCEPVSVCDGRYLSRGSVQSADGALLASFEQLGFIRPLRPPAA